MKTKSIPRVLTAMAWATALGLPAIAQESVTTDLGIVNRQAVGDAFKAPGYSPYAGRNFPTQVLWGDTHLHTAISLDAGAIGARLNPVDAYRFARGEEVVSNTGQRVRLSRPLDFLVVADHAEAFGSMVEVVKANPQLMRNPEIKRWHDMITAGGNSAFAAALEMVGLLSAVDKMPPEFKDSNFIRSVWEPYIKAADTYNEPGRFSAFIGYEWTSMPEGDNMHRVVMFRDGADKAIQTLPFSAIDSENVEDLWGALESYEKATGGRVMAIPHNSNVSGGRMFALADFIGNPLTREYAERRERWESVVEVTQQKGDSEAHPFLSPNDEFAAFDKWDKMNLGAVKEHEDSWFKAEYAREALKSGLKLEQELGVNPFKFGMIGSTDAHTALPAVEEENYYGKVPSFEPNPERIEHVVFQLNDKQVMGWEMAAAGYAAVWATENTREAIFDAMERKEVYATTGSRMLVRLFGGWNFENKDAFSRLPAAVGYSKGVPMGGDLTDAPEGKSPSFLVAALKDPYGANLDRIQIVKGWVDAEGRPQERIYDVAWSDADSRQPDTNGKLPPVGNTVDVAEAIWTNTIGDPELITVWRDPEFDPAWRAFYYARVIEIPTPRWTAYDAKYFGVALPPEVPTTTQERAYTSPIWYTPEG